MSWLIWGAFWKRRFFWGWLSCLLALRWELLWLEKIETLSIEFYLRARSSNTAFWVLHLGAWDLEVVKSGINIKLLESFTFIFQCLKLRKAVCFPINFSSYAGFKFLVSSHSAFTPLTLLVEELLVMADHLWNLFIHIMPLVTVKNVGLLGFGVSVTSNIVWLAYVEESTAIVVLAAIILHLGTYLCLSVVREVLVYSMSFHTVFRERQNS